MGLLFIAFKLLAGLEFKKKKNQTLSIINQAQNYIS